MASGNQTLLLIGILLSLVLAAHADPGSATYYSVFNPSACDGYDTPTGLIASASPEIWENRTATCGKRYRISCTAGTNLGVAEPCTGRSVEVTIVDLCPGCLATFDLSQDAFAVIADVDEGRILIEYDQV